MIFQNIDHVYEKNNMHEGGLQEKNDFLRLNLLTARLNWPRGQEAQPT